MICRKSGNVQFPVSINARDASASEKDKDSPEKFESQSERLTTSLDIVIVAGRRANKKSNPQLRPVSHFRMCHLTVIKYHQVPSWINSDVIGIDPLAARLSENMKTSRQHLSLIALTLS